MNETKQICSTDFRFRPENQNVRRANALGGSDYSLVEIRTKFAVKDVALFETALSTLNFCRFAIPRQEKSATLNVFQSDVNRRPACRRVARIVYATAKFGKAFHFSLVRMARALIWSTTLFTCFVMVASSFSAVSEWAMAVTKSLTSESPLLARYRDGERLKSFLAASSFVMTLTSASCGLAFKNASAIFVTASSGR